MTSVITEKVDNTTVFNANMLNLTQILRVSPCYLNIQLGLTNFLTPESRLSSYSGYLAYSQKFCIRIRP